MKVLLYDCDGTFPPMETSWVLRITHGELLSACWLVS